MNGTKSRPSRIRDFHPSDRPAWIRMIARRALEKGLSYREGERLARMNIERPGRRPIRDFITAEDKEGSPIGFGGLFPEKPLGRVVFFVFVEMDFRRRKIGSAILNGLMNRAAEMGVSEAHGRTERDDASSLAFLERNGFTRIRRHIEMECDLDGRWIEPKAPAGVLVDHFSSGEESRLAEIQNRVFQGSWGFCPNRKEEIRYYLDMTRTELEDVLLFHQAGRTIGYLWPSYPPENGKTFGLRTGRIHMLGLLTAFRGRGLGRDLLRSGLSELRDRGMKKVRLTVDSQNRAAIGLYREFGFRDMGGWLWYGRSLSRRTGDDK